MFAAVPIRIRASFQFVSFKVKLTHKYRLLALIFMGQLLILVGPIRAGWAKPLFPLLRSYQTFPVRLQVLTRGFEDSRTLFNSFGTGCKNERNHQEYPSAKPFLENERYLYHGIFFDPFRFKNIIQHGILTYRSAQKRNIPFLNNFGSLGLPAFNGIDRVSLAQSPLAHRFKDPAGFTWAFDTIISRSIAFIIEEPTNESLEGRIIWKSEGVGGEVFSTQDISPEKIKGILISPEIVNKPLSEVSTGLTQIEIKLIEPRTRMILNQIQKETGHPITPEEIENLLHDFRQGFQRKLIPYHVITDLDRKVSHTIENAYKEFLQKESVTIDHILTHYAPHLHICILPWTSSQAMFNF